MGIVITKLDNNNVEVTGKKQPYTLVGSMGVFRAESSASYKDGVSVQSEGKLMDFFTADNVDTVVRGDGTIVAISDADTLYSELKEFFFFEVGSSGGGGGTGFIGNIITTDWQVGGSSGFFVDVVHGLGTQTLNYEATDVTTPATPFVRILNEYFPLDDNTVRVESSIDTIDVDVLFSNGGQDTLIILGDGIVEDGTKLKYGTGSDYGVGGSKRMAGGINSTVNTDLSLSVGIGAKGSGLSVIVGNDVPRVASGNNFTALSSDVWYCETNSISIFAGSGQTTTGFRTRSLGSVMIGNLLNIQSQNPTNGTVNKGIFIGTSITNPVANTGAAAIVLGNTLNLGSSYELILIGKDITITGNYQRTVALGDELILSQDNAPNGVVVGYKAGGGITPITGATGGQFVAIGTEAFAGSWRCTVVGAFARADYVSSTVIGYGAYSGVSHGNVFGRGGYLITEGGVMGTLLHSNNTQDKVIIGNAYAKYTNPFVEGIDEVVDNVAAQNAGTVINKITTATGLDVDTTPTASNVKGAVLDISGGTSTGTAEGGELTFSSSPAGVSGNTLNADVIAAKIDAAIGVDTRFLLWDVANSKFVRVEIGAADSGSVAGKRMLEVLN